MSKALIFSDLHLHAHKDRVDRLENCVEVLHWIFRTAKERNCDYIFFLGDLFHEREKIDVLNYLRTFECFMEHMIKDAANRDVYLLVGNHDMYLKHRWDVNSVKPLTAIPRVHLIDKPTSTELGGRRIDWMPHTDNPVKELNALKKATGGAGDILFGHMSVHGALLNIFYGTKADVIVEYDNDMVPVDVSIFEDWKMTMLGHYHGAQKLNDKVEYVGSPHQLTFGEAFQEKHIILLDLDTLEKEYIVNNFSPKHYILSPQDIKDENYDLNGQFVRLAVDKLGGKEVVDLKKEIAEKYKVLSLDTKSKDKDKKVAEDQTVIDHAKTILLNTQQMLESYIEERGVPEGLDKVKLLMKGKECLEKKISS
jgi:DNA repair exonuclease SbcCD nuclease subunit